MSGSSKVGPDPSRRATGRRCAAMSREIRARQPIDAPLRILFFALMRRATRVSLRARGCSRCAALVITPIALFPMRSVRSHEVCAWSGLAPSAPAWLRALRLRLRLRALGRGRWLGGRKPGAHVDAVLEGRQRARCGYCEREGRALEVAVEQSALRFHLDPPPGPTGVL